MALVDNAPPLSDFRLLAFDIFGTLIDEPAGIHKALQPLLSHLPASHPAIAQKAAHELFFDRETAIHHESPSLRQHEVLARVYRKLAKEWDLPTPSPEDVEAFAQSMGEWPPFPDTVAAVQKLSKHYKLVPLSNCDRATFARVLEGPLKDVSFDAVYLAEDIGSYKPDHRNFEYLLSRVQKDFGVEKGEVLMVAHGLPIDHVPAKELGMESVWIQRESTEEDEKRFEGRVAYKWKFKTLGDLAQAVELEFGDK